MCDLWIIDKSSEQFCLQFRADLPCKPSRFDLSFLADLGKIEVFLLKQLRKSAINIILYYYGQRF